MSEDEPTVGEQLAVINVKLDTLLVQRDDHEARLRKLEEFKWKSLGAAATISSLSAAIMTLVLK